MNALLRLEIVPFSAVSETIQSMLTSIELNGPALLTEASANLLSTVIQQKIIESPTQYTYTAERVLNWFLSKWTPSK
jgi:ataxia telangiectasia mutated family protein